MVAHKMTIVNAGQAMELELNNATIKKKPKSTTFDGEF